MKKGNPSKEVKIKGLVTAAEWDDDDNIIAVTISTPDEEEYLVVKNDLGEELLNLVWESVKVTGYLEEDEDGTMMINVMEYEVIEEN